MLSKDTSAPLREFKIVATLRRGIILCELCALCDLKTVQLRENQDNWQLPNSSKPFCASAPPREL